eukprot:TRINITY_DN34615_c0_g1_i1.p1 TRINITY_DN34615_c0_g1~~TRINITY_DN34615_c0_g1_i1.p1  ORF type:complete len:333 (+),score=54.16 TRINITY_DN34615_c0_g1_i1:132-1001(+)
MVPLSSMVSSGYTGLVIWLHGLAGSAAEWDEQLDDGLRRRMPWIWWHLPEAPVRAITSHGRTEHRGWFDLEKVPIENGSRLKGLDESVCRVHGMLQEAERLGVQPSRVVLGGFSQGGLLALQAGLTYKRPVAGICAVSGWVDSELPNVSLHANLPVLMCHGDCDGLVPLDLAWRGAQALGANTNAPVVRFLEYRGLAHQFVPGEWEDIVDFLLAVLPEDAAATWSQACQPVDSLASSGMMSSTAGPALLRAQSSTSTGSARTTSLELSGVYRPVGSGSGPTVAPLEPAL